MAAPSYETIDYRIRSSKFIERAIFVDTFSAIPFYPLHEYKYVGLGAVYFVDFRLFHKRLGINQLYSIEQVDTDEAQRRFEYNQPFSCLTLMFGNTTTELPKLDFNTPTLVWMDYDDRLTLDVMADVRFLSNHLQSGSFVAFTVNCSSLVRAAKNHTDERKEALSLLAEAVGNDRIPPGTQSGDLETKGTAKVYHKLIVDEINSVLGERNASLSGEDQLNFKQTFFLRYADGAEMMTVGGFILNAKDRDTFNKTKYPSQPYFTDSDQAISIQVPKLTTKEILELEKIAPSADIEHMDMMDVPIFPMVKEVDIKNYLRTYRYLPNYVSAEIS